MNTLRYLIPFAALVATASAQVVITEIHYHPVEEPAFNASGAPSVDLTDDVHEFIEIQNTGAASVDLTGWTISGGIEFAIPPGTTLAPGAFAVIARDPVRLGAAYGMSPASILGPYTGVLDNGGDTVRLRNKSSVTVDHVSYSDNFPWPTSADEFGAQERFTGLKAADYQYKGRSLQRVSTNWPGNDPANWLASPLSPGPTPGGPQAVTQATPKPVVTGFTTVQASDNAPIVRADEPAKVQVTFSSGTGLNGVLIEYFLDDVEVFGEARQTVNMTPIGNNTYTINLPGLPDRTVLRYRFLADFGTGAEVVSPRPDDAAVSPVGPAGALEAWHAYFVTPVRTSTQPSYDMLVSAVSFNRMAFNITADPKRVTAYNANGIPREVPYVAPTAPIWNGTVPGIFANEGRVWDVHLRYHASRYHRTPGFARLKLHFPEFMPFHKVTSIFIVDGTKTWATTEGHEIFRVAGFPYSPARPIELYFNTGPVLAVSELGEFNSELLDEYHERQHRLNPTVPLEGNGEMYKSVGNIDSTANNLEGPYTRGDAAPIAPNSGWTALQRYTYTYNLQNNDWKGALPMRQFIENMWSARGDSYLVPNMNIPAARAWCNANLDVDATITALALFNWMGAWDDVCHNQFYWRRTNGRWMRLPWDFDLTMDDDFSKTQSIYVGETGAQDPFFGPNWFKDTVIKCFRTEFRQKMWELNNTLLDPTNLAALGFPNAAIFAQERQVSVSGELATAGLGIYHKPNRPTNVAPASGGMIIAEDAVLTASPYSHSNTGSPSPHSATKWEIRSVNGTYLDPVYAVTSTTSKTSLPVPYDQLVYGQTYFWRVTYFDTQNRRSIISAETSFTWGNASPAAGNLVLHEILADNKAAVENDGTFPDYIELRNNSGAPISLAGKGLTDDPAQAGKFVFPAGATIPAGGYVVVWCDEEFNAPGFHSGFRLSAEGQTVLLLDGNTVLDFVTYGPQVTDFAIGRTGSGTGGWQLVPASPGTVNATQTLGFASTLRINEWMAFPAADEDWFELHNASDLPVALGGLYLSDSASEPTKTRLPALSFAGPRAYVKFIADGSKQGRHHCDFRLSAGGDTLLLTDADGLTPLISLTFGPQTQGVSQGSLPDGTATIVSFPHSASPSASNWLPATIVINELLANTDPPFEDAIELYNPSGVDVNIGGWWLSDDRTKPKKFQLPAGTIVPANGYKVIYEDQFVGSFSLSSNGDELILSAVDGGGVLTGNRAQVSFGASNDGVAFGSIPLSDGGVEFWPLLARTFGVNSPATVAEFRTGTGATNAVPLIGPVIINEVNYHPPDTLNGDNALDEFIELHNVTDSPVNVAGWRLKGDLDFQFQAGTILAPGDYIVVVGFNPADAVALAGFRLNYSLNPDVVVLGPYTPRLSNENCRVELSKPGASGNGAPDILVDKVEYFDTMPWPTAADGNGSSLQRQSRTVIGNDPGNWIADVVTPASLNVGQLPFDPNNAGVFAFSAAASTVAEEDGSVTINVTRLLGGLGTVTVNYTTTGGTAVSGTDFTPTSGTLTFAENERDQTIVVPINDDLTGENAERFTVRLSSPGGGAFLASPIIHTVTIGLSDGGIRPGRIQFASATASVAEGAGSYTVTIARVNGSSGAVSAQLVQQPALGGAPNAVLNEEYTPTLPVTIAFAEGETQRTFTFTLLDDGKVEADEHLTLRLLGGTGGATIGSQPTHDVLLTNDDLPPPPYQPVVTGFTGIVNESFNPASYGFVQFKTTATGAMSGKLLLDGVTYPLSGKFETTGATAGEFRRTIRMKVNGQLNSEILLLKIDQTGTSFTGSIRGLTIRGEKNLAGTKQTPVAGAGKYTALLKEEGTDGPLGYLVVTIAPTGAVTYQGVAADGTKLTGASALSITRSIPLCSGLYTQKKGCLFGFGASIAGFEEERDVFTADLIWNKPPPAKLPGAGVFPGGFAKRLLRASGTEYRVPAKGQQMLPAFASAEVLLKGGNLPSDLGPFTANVSSTNKLTIGANSSKLALGLTSSSGLLKGTFKHSDGKTRKLSGVVVQQDDEDGRGIIEGHFPGTSLPGYFTIKPPPAP